MCDTILAAPTSTARRSMLFGKNSDRQPNEAQVLEYVPRRSYAAGAKVGCTYISIPQTQQTHAVLLSRPFWIWGAEMGANEHGVVVGNEGVHARIGAPQDQALVGMDLVRLGLERGSTAAEAVEVMTALLAIHGQGGNCGHLTPTYYNNSFTVADATEAYVLETVKREWLVKRVRDVCAISNAYTIGSEVERCSAGLTALIREHGWSDGPVFDYAAVIADPAREHIGNAGARRACSTSALEALAGRLEVSDIMSILRNHGHGETLQMKWSHECTVKRTVCMHAGIQHSGQTVASMVSEVRGHGAVHWVTGTAAPCISIFKPVLLDVAPPQWGPPPTDRFDPRTLWWRHERLHRAGLRSDFGRFLSAVREEQVMLEARFRVRIDEVLKGGNVDDRAHVVAECWDEAAQAEATWHARADLSTATEREPLPPPWPSLNHLAGL